MIDATAPQKSSLPSMKVILVVLAMVSVGGYLLVSHHAAVPAAPDWREDLKRQDAGIAQSRAQLAQDAADREAEAETKKQADAEAHAEYVSQQTSTNVKADLDQIDMALKDAAHARYRDTYVSGEGMILCGLINAPDSFGAYTGWEPFVATKDSVYIAGSSKHFEEAFERLCKLSDRHDYQIDPSLLG